MSPSPMHDIPGAFQKLQQLYAEGLQANESQEYEKAVALFSEGIGIDDNFRHQYVTMYARRAEAYQGLERYDEAIADYDKALEMEPDITHARHLYNRAQCKLDKQDLDDAVVDLRACVALNDNVWMAHALLGDVLAHQGHFPEAIQSATRGHQIGNNDTTRSILERVQEAQKSAIQDAQSQVQAGAGAADPEVFPGQPIARLSDYVAVMKKMQTGDMQGALAPYGLDLMAYGAVAAQWAQKLGADPMLNARFAQLMAAN